MCIQADQSAVCAINRHLLLCVFRPINRRCARSIGTYCSVKLQSEGGAWHPLALIHLANAAALFLPVLPTLLRCSYPFCQRCCAATAAQSGRTKGSSPPGQVRRKECYCCAVRQNERQLVLRTQAS